MKFEDYLDNFALTAICVEANSKYNHNHVICDLRQKTTVEFKFKIEETILADDTFTIFVAQQGDRLGRERLQGDKKFEPQSFKIYIYD